MRYLMKGQQIIVFFIVLMLWCQMDVVIADPPSELRQIQYKDISKETLKNAIGILTIFSVQENDDRELTTYQRTDNIFTVASKLHIRKDMLPLTICGYFSPIRLSQKEYESLWQTAPQVRELLDQVAHDDGDDILIWIDEWIESHEATLGDEIYARLKQYQRMAVFEGAFRYPIRAQYHQYVQVVYNPVTNAATWINVNELGIYHEVVLVDELHTYRKNYIDIFYLAPEVNTRKLYAKPSTNAKSTEFTFDKWNDFWAIMITEQENGFAKIVDVSNITQEKELGWIKIRDEQGCLTLWLICLDLC